ncbi:histone demethylase JARID1, partial [Fistulifera solaris]
MSTANHRAAKRRRRRPPSYFQFATATEERYLAQAIQNSKLDRTRQGKLDIPWAPVFFPTVEEMEGNPLDYIAKIQGVAERYGICKIVPPKGWNPSRYFGIDIDRNQKTFATKLQMLHRLQEGVSFGDGNDYAAKEYLQVSSERTKAWKNAHYPDHDLLARHTDASDGRRQFTPDNLERDYWDVVETHTKEVAVEYGNDVDTHDFGSGFPLSERGRSVHGTRNAEKMNLPEPKFGTEDYYKETWWNLNNIPSAPGSVLQYVKVGINGVNCPWMYFGSLFTTFCWHNEDNYMYSINYHHKGAPKQWYGVPGEKKAAEGLERVFKNYLSMKMRDVPDLLHHITTMFSPRLLQNADVVVSKLLQYEGEFVVTFPRSFHSGFSLGPNVGEAVNFATPDWISYGSEANERYRSFSRPAVFSQDRLTFTMANHLEDVKSYATCRRLLNELERVVQEELRLRKKLSDDGVRDVSDVIALPRNSLDQLDEKSASYDDRRLCHACKHVCFSSAVACQCSQSKVSCLRHSHFMCRCPTERKYFMLWTSNEELKSTLEKVRAHCESLKISKDQEVNAIEAATESALLGQLPDIAPGVERDLEIHRNQKIWTDPLTLSSIMGSLDMGFPVENRDSMHKVPPLHEEEEEEEEEEE